MRSRGGRHSEIDEAQSYLASISDLMSGLIFIFVIALAVFAFSLSQVEENLRDAEEELTNTESLRRELLEHIQRSLQNEGVTVTVDLENGILRLPEQILFPLGRAELTAEGREAVQELSAVLAAVLPCYTQREEPAGCDSWHPGLLEALFVEGHTDDLPVARGGRYRSNWELSVERALNTYRELLAADKESILADLRNGRDQAVFSVTGYAEHRPVAENSDDVARALNRRIDLRFIMAAPQGRDRGQAGASLNQAVQESGT